MHPMSFPRQALASLALLLSFLASGVAGAADPGPDPAPTATATSDPAGILADHPGFGSGSPRTLLQRQLGRLPLLPNVTQRHALAVITDFADSRLEDWTGAGFNSSSDIRHTLDEMTAHWEWLSHGKEDMRWDIIRVTLPVNLTPTAYPGWPEFREAVAALIRQQVNVADYDANHDGVIDSVWVIASTKGADYDYLIGGTSSNGGVNLFVDGQASLSVRSDAYGNFNHELGHTLGLPDLYGPYDTLHYLTLMSDSWPVPPQDFTAYERSLLGWSTPRLLGSGRTSVSLRPATASFDALRINTGRPNEYFLIEYRKRPDSGFGSSAPDYDGLAVYHVLDGSSQWIDPPLVKLEAADGEIGADQAPTANDFLYPGNPQQRSPLALRSYFGGVPVALLDHVRRDGSALRVDIKVSPPLSPTLSQLLVPNLLRNPSFENGRPQPTDWSHDAYNPGAQFALSSTARDGSVSATITAPGQNDARWTQTVSDLVPGQTYQFCGQLRGRGIQTSPTAQYGGNVSVIGGFIRSPSLSGDFDWTQSCLTYQPVSATDTFACRLGFYGSVVTGKLWCDRMTLYPLKSAFPAH